MSDTPNEKSQNARKWRRDFAFLMRQERELSGLKTEECPKDGRYQEQIEAAARVPELSYLLRLMMWFRHNKKTLPSQNRLRRLLILWCLARIESIIGTDDFKEQAVTDYEIIHKPTGDKEDHKEEISRVFEQKWRKSALEAQQYFQDTLFPVYEGIDPRGVPDKVDDKPLGHLPTLDLFPEAFDNLVVVVGGYGGPIRREPAHVSELFRQSQSFVNLHYLLHLNLHPDTEIVSDQLLLELSGDRERAIEILGRKHILVIGSPLVNAFSRHLILNKRLIFNFVFNKETYRLGQDIYDNIIKTRLLETKSALRMFDRLMDTEPDKIESTSSDYEDVEEADRKQIKELVFRIRALTGNPKATSEQVTDMFLPDRMFSPFEPTLRASHGNTLNEFAIISLAENFWAQLLREKDEPPKYASIVVSGVNELSTTLAVKALSEKDYLKERPLGGLLKIEGIKTPGPKHITGAGHKWMTPPYPAQDVLKTVDQVLESFDERPSAFDLFENKSELEMYREIVKQYI